MKGEDQRTILREYLRDSYRREQAMEIEDLEKELAESSWVCKLEDNILVTNEELMAEIEEPQEKCMKISREGLRG
jgi:hypothetical protein